MTDRRVLLYMGIWNRPTQSDDGKRISVERSLQKLRRLCERGDKDFLSPGRGKIGYVTEQCSGTQIAIILPPTRRVSMVILLLLSSPALRPLQLAQEESRTDGQG